MSTAKKGKNTTPSDAGTTPPTAAPIAKPPNLVLDVFSRKGGVGKTTLSTAAALVLESRGYNCLLLDLDFSGTCSLDAFLPLDAPDSVAPKPGDGYWPLRYLESIHLAGPRRLGRSLPGRRRAPTTDSSHHRGVRVPGR